jgi:hypothetical protein
LFLSLYLNFFIGTKYDQKWATPLHL